MSKYEDALYTLLDIISEYRVEKYIISNKEIGDAVDSLEELINEIDMKIKNHPMLNDTTSIEKKKKLYSRIAWISLCVPFVIIGILAIFLIYKDSIQLNKWFIIFLAVPVIIWLVFDAKSKRLK